jgi:cytochrome b561
MNLAGKPFGHFHLLMRLLHWEAVLAAIYDVQAGFLARRQPESHQLSSVNPTFTVTCQCATLLF